MVFAAAVLLCLRGLAAQYSSSIEGIVTDRSRAVVPSAVVAVANAATGVVRRAATTNDGFYRVVDLSPGRYDVTVEHAGFRTSEEPDVALNGSETVRLNIVLDLGAVSDRVTVQGPVTAQRPKPVWPQFDLGKQPNRQTALA